MFRSCFILLMVFTILLYTIGLPLPELMGADEPREAGIGVEMAISGNLVVPRLNGEAFLEKPPFYYWIQVFCYNCFGIGTLAARLPAVLCAVGGVAVTFWLAAAMGFGPLSAFLSGLVLAMAPQFWASGRTAMLDMTLAAMIGATIYCFFRCARSSRWIDRLVWMLLYAASLGAALMTKGLVGLAMPGLVLGGWLFFGDLLRRRFNLNNWLMLAVGSLLGLIPFACWLWLLYGELGWDHGVKIALIDNNFGRFTGKFSDSHIEPFYYYFTKLGEIFQPWMSLLPFAVYWHVRRLKTGRAGGHLLMLCWGLLPCLMLMAAAGKRMVYLLPLNPAWALLVGVFLAAVLEGRIPQLNRYRVTPVLILRWLGAALGPLTFIAAVAIVITSYFMKIPLWNVIPLALVILILAALMIYFDRHSCFEHFFITTLLQTVMIFGVMVIMSAHYRNQRNSFRPLFANVARELSDGKQVLLYRSSERIRGATMFYLQRSLPALSRPEELAEALRRPSGRRLVVLTGDDVELPGFKTVYRVKIRKGNYILAESESGK